MKLELLGAWARTWEWLAGRADSLPKPLPRPPFAEQYDAVYASIDPKELQDESEPMDEAALIDELFRVDGRGQRFLGYYSEDGARRALERYGFFDLLRDRGFEPILVGDVSDPDEHRMRIYDGDESVERLLIELVVGVRAVTLPNQVDCRFLFVNWLQMQDPRAVFPADRTPLPDQDHPGLGLFIQFAYLLKLISDRIGCDGLLNHPSHPHNGVLYGKVCHFVDPVIEGRFRALERDLGTEDLAELTALVQSGAIVDDDGAPYVWEPAPQVLPVSRRARGWFRSKAYCSVVEATGQSARFRRLDSD